MEKINISEEIKKDRNSMLVYLLINTMSHIDTSSLEKFNLKKEDGINNWAEVKLTINGVECDLRHFAETIDNQLDELVKREASSMIDEVKNELQEKVENVLADLKSKMGLRECTCYQYDRG